MQLVHDDKTAVVTCDLVASCIKTLPNGKATGPDHIAYEHLKYGVEALTQPLADIFTLMLRQGHIPDNYEGRRNYYTP